MLREGLNHHDRIPHDTKGFAISGWVRHIVAHQPQPQADPQVDPLADPQVDLPEVRVAVPCLVETHPSHPALHSLPHPLLLPELRV